MRQLPCSENGVGRNKGGVALFMRLTGDKLDDLPATHVQVGDLRVQLHCGDGKRALLILAQLFYR